jgi:solute carrier family 13 (sodium-dependent dicarboxylate transporter), member 2/3/5
MASICVVMSVYWLLEPIPLAVTAMIPLILYPLFGIMDATAAAREYANDSITLFWGGFAVAKVWPCH